jgi:hypothetical protein
MIEANIPLVMRGIAKKHKEGGARSEFVRGCGGEVGVTFAPENP